jgi:hypothetical protein
LLTCLFSILLPIKMRNDILEPNSLHVF